VSSSVTRELASARTTRQLLQRRWLHAGLVYSVLIGAVFAAGTLLSAGRTLIDHFRYIFLAAFAGPYLYMYRTRCLSCGGRLGWWAVYSLRDICWRWGPRWRVPSQTYWHNCPRCGASIDREVRQSVAEWR
jgi:hypothetical protein